MISTQRYFIHIDNKSVIPWTSEVEGNYKFKEITAKIAMAIEHGKITADEVVRQITSQIKPGTLEQMLDAKLKMNVREGALNLEEQVKEDNTQRDTGEVAPYEVKIPGEGGGKKSAAGGKPGNKSDKSDKPDKSNKSNKPDKPDKSETDGAVNGESEADAAAKAAAEKAAAALGEEVGGVNV